MNKIEFPKNVAFQLTLQVRISDINYGMHLANDSVAKYVNEARVAFFVNLGYESELNIEGRSLIMRNSFTQYKSEGFYGNDIQIDVFVEVTSKKEFDLFFKLSHQSDGKPLAFCRTSMLCFDYSSRKPIEIPQRLLEKFSSIGT